MRTGILAVGIIFMIVGTCFSQAQAQVKMVVKGTIVNGDTLPSYNLSEVVICAHFGYLTPEEIKKNQKLIRNVKKTLPYAKLARARLTQLDAQVAGMSEKQRKAAMKQAEKDITAEFSEELKRLTISQGKVLLKLIDRETGRTSYVLVNDLRGKLRAGFYQTFARIFGYNLKSRFNPQGDKYDNLIERTVLSIEAGII